MNKDGCESVIMGGLNCRDCKNWSGYNMVRGEKVIHPATRTKDGRLRRYCAVVDAVSVENFGCADFSK